MKKLLKKFAFSFFAFLIVFSAVLPNFSSTKVRAAGIDDLWIHQWYGETNPLNWYAKVYDTSNPGEIFGERYTAAQVQWIAYGVFSMFWNIIPGNPELTICVMKGDIATCGVLLTKFKNIILDALGLPLIAADGAPMPLANPNGGKNLLFTVVDTIGQSPVSGIAYFKDLSSRFSLVSPVKAQGIGFSTAGSSVLPLWRITRNISYTFMVIAVIILSFMIMFRVKINPQVVITIQSAIPKLIIALILITFSYAIAGLLVDLMYVIIGILSVFISSQGLSSESATGLFNLFTKFYSAVGLLWLYWLQFVWTALKSIVTSGWGGAVPGFFAFIFAVVTILAIIVWTFKIIFMLLKNYIMIILAIITGPLEIMLGTVTQGVGFGSWFKKMMSYLAVYPVTALMFFLAFFFLNQGVDGGTDTTSWMPFLPTANVVGMNTWAPPLSVLASKTGGLVWLFVSFFVFSQITKVAQMIQAFISGKPFDYGIGIGEGAMGAKIAAGAGATLAESRLKESRTHGPEKTLLAALTQILGRASK